MDHPEDKSGELPDFQQTVTDFIEEHGIEAPAYARLLDLSSEAGELSKEYLKNTNYGRRTFGETTDGWSNELGDVFFSLVCLANSTGVDLQTALQGSLKKYDERLRRRGCAGSGG